MYCFIVLPCKYQITSVNNSVNNNSKNNLIAKYDYFKDDSSAKCELVRSD